LAITASDFNGDDNLDLGVANQGSAAVSILLGNGDGIFRPGQSVGCSITRAPWRGRILAETAIST